MTNSEIGTVERAFQLAQAGACESVEDIRRQLRRERHSNIDGHLGGPSIRKQLVQEIAIGRDGQK